MTISIAILGTAHYHANFWTRAFIDSPDAVVAGVWDADAGQAGRFAAQHGVVVEPDLVTLIAASDAVAICSATSDHVALVEAAAARGRPVLCEKPLGATADDCARIAAIVDASGIRFMQSFPKRFDPVNHEIEALLKGGELGKITLCRIRHGHSHGFSEAFRWHGSSIRRGPAAAPCSTRACTPPTSCAGCSASRNRCSRRCPRPP